MGLAVVGNQIANCVLVELWVSCGVLSELVRDASPVAVLVALLGVISDVEPTWLLVGNCVEEFQVAVKLAVVDIGLICVEKDVMR